MGNLNEPMLLGRQQTLLACFSIVLGPDDAFFLRFRPFTWPKRLTPLWPRNSQKPVADVGRRGDPQMTRLGRLNHPRVESSRELLGFAQQSVLRRTLRKGFPLTASLRVKGGGRRDFTLSNKWIIDVISFSNFNLNLIYCTNERLLPTGSLRRVLLLNKSTLLFIQCLYLYSVVDYVRGSGSRILKFLLCFDLILLILLYLSTKSYK